MRESAFTMSNDPRIIESYFVLNKERREDIEKKTINIDMTSKVDIKFNEENNNALVIMELGIFTDKEIVDVPFKIKVVVEGLFSWDEDIDGEELKLLLEQNAPAILYGYARQEVRMMTLNANIPVLNIPLMNFKKDSSD